MEHAQAGTRRTRARAGEGDRLREEIIGAATRLLVDAGDESAVTVRAVAKAVGCTPAAIYLHFADRSELIFAVCERQFAHFADQVDAAVSGVDDPGEALRALARAYVAFGLRHPEEYRVLFMAHPGWLPDGVAPEELLATGGFDRAVEAVATAMDAGVLRPGDPFAVATRLWVTIHGVTSLMISKPWFPWPDGEAFVDRLVEEQLGALAP